MSTKRARAKSATDNFTAGVEDEGAAPVPVLDVAAMLGGSEVTIAPYQPRTNREVSDANEAMLIARAGPLTGQPRHDPVTFEPYPDPPQVALDELVDPVGNRAGPELDPTIGEILHDTEGALADEPYIPGFAMSDEPLPLPGAGIAQSAAAPGGEAAPQPPQSPQKRETSVATMPVAGAIDNRPTIAELQSILDSNDDRPVTINPDGTITVPDGDIISPRERRLVDGAVRYEGRIRIMEAFQYMGGLASAPEWIDRNWVGYGDHDDLRNIPAGPALRVPLRSGNIAVARIGDYIVQQEVLLSAGMPTELRVEVWPKDDFEKNFLPVT